MGRLSEDKTAYTQDLAVQLLLRHGQVEVEEGDFVPDYSGSVLVHRRAIEELNKEIKVKSYPCKLSILCTVDTPDSRRGKTCQHE